MEHIRRRLQHLLNPLHLYCRLMDAGWPAPLARGLSRTWEHAVYRRLLA